MLLLKHNEDRTGHFVTLDFTFQYASIIDIIINIILYFKFASIKSCTYTRQKDKKLTIKL